MRVASTAVSLTTHVAFILAAVWATTNAHPRVTRETTIVELPPLPDGPDAPPLPPAPTPVELSGGVAVPTLASPTIDGVDVHPATPGFDVHPLSGPVLAPATPGNGAPIDESLVDQLPVMLAGPVPVYPDLLRQARIQGRVMLEAVVDTLGHVEPGSIVVVATAHPGFVAPAQQALRASLFRPARVRGTAVRVRVRMAFDFVVRGGRL